MRHGATQPRRRACERAHPRRGAHRRMDSRHHRLTRALKRVPPRWSWLGGLNCAAGPIGGEWRRRPYAARRLGRCEMRRRAQKLKRRGKRGIESVHEVWYHLAVPPVGFAPAERSIGERPTVARSLVAAMAATWWFRRERDWNRLGLCGDAWGHASMGKMG